jgi:hypothetical protein
MTYEYKIVDGGFFTDYDRIVKTLNTASKKGWRLMPLNISPKGVALVMEREISEVEA